MARAAGVDSSCARTTVGGARRIVGELVRVMRMDADRDPHLGPDRGERERLRRFLRVARRQDRQDSLDAAVTRPANDRFEVSGKHLVGEVAMGVNHHLRGK